MVAEIVVILRLLLATFLGGLIGFEREMVHKPAGLRTHMLVCIASTLVTMSGLLFTNADTARLAAGIITGIGFLGAGTIIAARGHILGLTTAASLWSVAGVGVAIGIGFYFAAIVASVLIFFVLSGVRRIEEKSRKSRKK